MGWNSGGELLQRIVNIVEPIDMLNQDRTNLYVQLIRAFESFDCDVIDEIEGGASMERAKMLCGYHIWTAGCDEIWDPMARQDICNNCGWRS